MIQAICQLPRNFPIKFNRMRDAVEVTPIRISHHYPSVNCVSGV